MSVQSMASNRSRSPSTLVCQDCPGRVSRFGVPPGCTARARLRSRVEEREHRCAACARHRSASGGPLVPPLVVEPEVKPERHPARMYERTLGQRDRCRDPQGRRVRGRHGDSKRATGLVEDRVADTPRSRPSWRPRSCRCPTSSRSSGRRITLPRRSWSRCPRVDPAIGVRHGAECRSVSQATAPAKSLRRLRRASRPDAQHRARVPAGKPGSDVLGLRRSPETPEPWPPTPPAPPKVAPPSRAP